MGRHSGVWVEEYSGAQGRSSDGALYLVRKCILSDTTSTAVVTPWQPTYIEKSILNEVTWLQTRSLFFAQAVLLPVTAPSHFRFCYLPGISKFQYRCLAEKWLLRLKINFPVAAFKFLVIRLVWNIHSAKHKIFNYLIILIKNNLTLDNMFNTSLLIYALIYAYNASVLNTSYNIFWYMSNICLLKHRY